MKRSNDIFFLTLIDFLVQVVFFGMVLYAVHAASARTEKTDEARQAEQIQKILASTGVSNLTELTDELTTLAPIKELKGTSEFLKKFGTPEDAERLAEISQEVGAKELVRGADIVRAVTKEKKLTAAELSARLEKLRKFEEGQGLPPCLYTLVGERKRPRPIATVIGNDTTIKLVAAEPEFAELLALLGRTRESVQELPLAQFSATFSPLNKLKSDCRYTLRFQEQTELIHARDAAQVAFYLSLQRR